MNTNRILILISIVFALIIAAAVAVVLWIYLMPQTLPAPTEQAQTSTPMPDQSDGSVDTSASNISQDDGPCGEFECLFKVNGDVVGYGTVTGYYHPEVVQTGSDGADDKETCDRLVVTAGSQSLINDFIALVNEGNTLNGMTDGHLSLNIDLSAAATDPALAQKIKASTAENPISLGVLRGEPQGKDAMACTSLVRIVNENPAN